MSMPVVIVEQVWYLYRFYDDGGRLLYIGQTGRMAVARWLEHIKHQWWAGEIARMERQPLTYSSKAAVTRAEEIAIKSEFPLHNDKHNHNNPNRIVGPPHGVVVQQVRRPAARTPLVQVRAFAWTTDRVCLIVAIVAWPTLFGVLDWAGHNAGAAAVLTAVAFAVTWRKSGRRRRRRRVW